MTGDLAPIWLAGKTIGIVTSQCPYPWKQWRCRLKGTSEIRGLQRCSLLLACVASVSVWFPSKERPRNGILGFGRARNQTRAKKWKWGEGEGEGKEWNSGMTGQVSGFQNPGVCLQAFPSFLPHPLPSLLLTPFSARSLTLVPRSLLLNRTETLATQASLLRACDTQRPALATRRSLTARSRS